MRNKRMKEGFALVTRPELFGIEEIHKDEVLAIFKYRTQAEYMGDTYWPGAYRIVETKDIVWED